MHPARRRPADACARARSFSPCRRLRPPSCSRPIDPELAAACGLDPLSLYRDGRVRVSRGRRAHDLQGHRLRRAARRRHQHHRRRVDLVEMAASRARRPGPAARLSRRRARSGCSVEKRSASLAAAALGDLTTILRHPRSAQLTRVYRWDRSSPQQEVGHGELMTAHRCAAGASSRALHLRRGLPRRRHPRLHRRRAGDGAAAAAR